MKHLKFFLIILVAVFFTLSCQKEYSLEDGAGSPAAGTLKEDSFGDCLPSAVNGIYKKDSTLGAQNYIDVQVNVTTIGSYTITSDTVSGFSFKAIGSFTAVGLNTVRLKAAGKPLAAGFYTFTIKFGISTCAIEVQVLGAGASIAAYTLQCSGTTVDGTYKQGVSLNFNNTVTLNVNVTALGNFTIGSSSVNGMFFQSTGVFTTTGPQTVTLDGQGTPTASGTSSLTAGIAPNSCTFSVVVTSSTSAAAAYTFAGAPGNCTGVVLAGTYRAGTATGAANTVKFNVNVTTAGTYSITTAAVNGVTFAGAGSFAVTGAQTVTLTASGTPTTANTSSYTATGAAATSCAFPVTFTAAAPPAVCTLGGAPGVCTGAVASGTYAMGTVLSATNTVTVTANVTTIGSYSITTPAVNGMTFTASGTFAATGAQTVTLTGSGTPLASGIFTFAPQVGTSSCTFNVTVTGGAATDFITCTINGTATNFNQNIFGEIDISAGFPVLRFWGETVAGVDPYFEIDIVKQTGGAITNGTYTVNQLASGILVAADYFDAASVNWYIQSDPLATQTPGFTIIITSITATRVMGTFSGTLPSFPAPGSIRTVTNGSFSVPL